VIRCLACWALRQLGLCAVMYALARFKRRRPGCGDHRSGRFPTPGVQWVDVLALQMVRLIDRLPRPGGIGTPHRTQAHLAGAPGDPVAIGPAGRAGF
jgi:hypothetical protein